MLYAVPASVVFCLSVSLSIETKESSSFACFMHYLPGPKVANVKFEIEINSALQQEEKLI